MVEAAAKLDGWKLLEFASVDSTNLVSMDLPVWSAVVAETQSAGRGRFQRTWISDKGGLWLSAVIPPPSRLSIHRPVEPPVHRANSALPLVAGLAVCRVLAELGVAGLRMRWPNDVLANDRKLAGLLLDQFAPDRVVVGIGLNVFNNPEACDAALKNQTTRLADLLSPTPQLGELTALILGHLRRLVLECSGQGFGAACAQINALWGPPRAVELELDRGRVRGVFTAVADDGSLLLRDDQGQVSAYQAHEVRHLQELPKSTP
jgi:BirA family biotin operon repressor/biotin-[acetyl-CoA-carboxylase] ligase